MNEGRGVAVRQVPDSEPARRLEDLALVRIELEQVVALSSQLELLLASTDDPDHRLSAQASWQATLVHYARCFGGGRRRPLSTEHVEHLGLRNAGEFCKWLVDLRNKHISHSVNVFESCEVGFALESGEDDTELVLADIVAVVATAPLPPPETAGHIRALVEALLQDVQAQIEHVQDKVLDDLQRRPLSELLGQPDLQVGMAPPSQVRRIRK